MKRSLRQFTSILCAGLFLLSLLFVSSALLAQDKKTPTSVERGDKLFEELKCGDCHFKGHDGEGPGKDLSKEGTKRDQQWLMNYLKEFQTTHSKYTQAFQESEIQDLSAYLLSDRSCSEKCH
ncbi:MAG: c-type cytochrome [Candidatus Tectomicrobia bacterium]|uniref:C-type cytochrome n=1 Tax=Tectimicrobiota bacterium TaxID=2528274 RepID=A0A932GPB5_UNCTE|nr:c-type cytochrome [Candidatus Tectomicrobia bacterium]